MPEPHEVQRQLCIATQEAFYDPRKSRKPLYMLPWNHYVAVGSESPGWVWLSPTPEKAGHQYGKFLFRLDGARLSTGYAIEKGYAKEIADYYKRKPLDRDWTWWDFLRDLKSGKLIDAVLQARKDCGCLYAVVNLIWFDDEREEQVVMAVDKDGKLTQTDEVSELVRDRGEAACDHLSGLAESLEKYDDHTYVGVQFLVSFDLEKEEPWLVGDLRDKLLAHFHPWVPFKGSH